MGRRTYRTAVLLAAALAAACGRPVGDFGRAEPSYLHDTLMPRVGENRAWWRDEPHSSLPHTTDETELNDRAWNFVRAPHVADWWLDSLIEGERTRILPMLKGTGSMTPELADTYYWWVLPVFDAAYDTTRYHRYLLKEGFSSESGRWHRVAADITADTALVPPFCAVAARVRQADVDRYAALKRGYEVGTPFDDDVMARIYENEEAIAWVWRAISYRLSSYRFAIDRLEIEAPSPEAARGAKLAYNALAASKCTGAPTLRSVPSLPERHSRLLDRPDPFYTEPVPQK
jgi:hypothetical protein